MNEMIGSMLDRLSGALQRFRAANAGNVAITFGIALLPVVGMVGAGVDYSRASRIKTVLQGAADAAAVGSVAKSSKGYAAALAMSKDGPVPAGQTQAVNIFNGEIQGKTGFTVTNINANVTRANWQVTSTVQFTADVPTVLMEVLGFKKMTVTGISTAVTGLPAHIDFYLLLDNTSSMGVGATQADIDTLINATKKYPYTQGLGCAFACHSTTAPYNDPASPQYTNFYQDAKNLGVTKRIDVLASATAQLMDTANTTQSMVNQFRVAIYTFGSWGSINPSDMSKAVLNGYAPHQVTALTSNLSSAKAQAAQIDLMTVTQQSENNDQGTNFDAVLTAMNLIIPNPGDGHGKHPPQKLLFFVSDGVADEPNALCTKKLVPGTTRCQQPLTAALCDAIKNRGIRIAVLYTTYLPLPTNNWYMTYVDPFNKTGSSEISANMQACASPGLYSEVGPGQNISAALNKLFAEAVATAHLTQ